jgi:predicted unusual protein kinase regulating ubiquinone biosynthesis (AarF/ABC1/UbiB family)
VEKSRDNKSKAPPASRTARFFKLAGMTASVATQYAGQRVGRLFGDVSKQQARQEKAYEKMATQIADTLGELKGAVMKVGQIASQTQDFLPREFSQALQKLQKEAPPMPFADIEVQIRSELGDDPHALFAHIDPQPYAAASIGQVHRARTHDGREVIIKVQYPGVDRSIDSDLKQLKLTLKLGGLLKIPKESVDQLFNEIRDRLSEELDYTNEARNIKRFRHFHQGDPGLIIPEVIETFSTRRVLTMAFVEGDHISEVNPSRYSQDIINLIGHRLFTTMADQLFRFQAIHGDPHAGNFAFRPDGTVIMYDFGCVKQLKPEIVNAYRRTLTAALQEDYIHLDQCLIDLGARVGNKPPIDEAYYAMWRDILIRPFASHEQWYDFSEADLHKQVAAKASSVLQYLDSFKPPVESIFIDRMIAGHYWMMRRLGVQAAFRGELESYL